MPSSVATKMISFLTLILFENGVSILPKNDTFSIFQLYKRIPSCPAAKASNPLSSWIPSILYPLANWLESLY